MKKNLSKTWSYSFLLFLGLALMSLSGWAQSSTEESASKGKPAEETASKSRVAEPTAMPNGAMASEKALASRLMLSANGNPLFGAPPAAVDKDSSPQQPDGDKSGKASGQQNVPQAAGQPAQGGAAPPAADTDELRKAAQNPIASLISVPFQWNSNFGIGEFDRVQSVMNIQPVVPVSLSEDWNLIMRFITPIIDQPDPTTPNKGTFGLGDMNPTFFFSPAKPKKLIWGLGPVLVLPTAFDRTLGQGKLSMGPSFVGLAQTKKWTLGLLTSNVWSVAGKSDRPAVNQFLFQYFINYNMAKGYYLTWQPIVLANWRAPDGQKWTVPLGGGLGRVFKLGPQPVNINFQVYATPVRPSGSSSFTIRTQFTLLYPK